MRKVNYIFHFGFGYEKIGGYDSREKILEKDFSHCRQIESHRHGSKCDFQVRTDSANNEQQDAEPDRERLPGRPGCT
jgi:hypothetical protein